MNLVDLIANTVTRFLPTGLVTTIGPDWNGFIVEDTLGLFDLLAAFRSYSRVFSSGYQCVPTRPMVVAPKRALLLPKREVKRLLGPDGNPFGSR